MSLLSLTNLEWLERKQIATIPPFNLEAELRIERDRLPPIVSLYMPNDEDRSDRVNHPITLTAHVLKRELENTK